jgi:signal peptidase I
LSLGLKMRNPSVTGESRRQPDEDAARSTPSTEVPVEEGRPPRPDETTDEKDPTAPKPSKGGRKHSFWRELPVLVVIAFAVALLIKTFLLQAFYIPSASMEPTLIEGDRVLVEKLAYRFGEPERGDVVVFERDLGVVAAPEDGDSLWEDITNAFKGLFGFPTGTSQDFIKRVIAVEGDKVEAENGEVLVNGEAIEEPYLPEGVDTTSFGPVDVPSDHIFVMGDNRNNSDDSRSFGPVKVGEVVGHAFVLIWPPADVSTL